MRFFKTTILGVAMAAASVFAFAGSLEENSPFIPFDQKGQAAPVGAPVEQVGSLEFRGVLDFGGEVKISLFDKAKKKSFWVKLNDESAPVVVNAYDAKAGTVTLKVDGRDRTLGLKKPSGIPLAINSASVGAASRAPARRAPASRIPRKIGPAPNPEKKEKADKIFDAFKNYVDERKKAGELE